MMYLVFLLATLAYGIRTKLHAALQVTPDANCQAWLDSEDGVKFLACENGNLGVPVPVNSTFTNTTTNITTSQCELSQNDFSTYCNNSCYDILTTGYKYFLNNGVCLAVYEDKYKPCSNNSDCATVGNITRKCHQGFCYVSCNTSSDCNSCLNETCQPLGSNGNGCWNPTRVYQNGSALANRTIQNAFRGVVYSLEASCSRNNLNPSMYCGMLDWTNMANMTCDTLNSQWGCCASTILGSMEWCEWTNFTNTNTSTLYNCNFSQPPCGGLPSAQSFCTFNITRATNVTNSSSTHGGGGTTSNPRTGGSSWLVTGVNGPNGNGASSQAIMSWTVILALVLAAIVA